MVKIINIVMLVIFLMGITAINVGACALRYLAIEEVNEVQEI